MSTHGTRGFAFGNFRLFPEEALLLRSGQPVPLPPKTFKMLCFLVENQGHVVDKESLMREIWPDTFVVDGNLRFNIAILRKALCDNGHSRELIVTLPKRGYKFVGELEEIGSEIESVSAIAPAAVDTTPANTGSADITFPEGPLSNGKGKLALGSNGHLTSAPAAAYVAGDEEFRSFEAARPRSFSTLWLGAIFGLAMLGITATTLLVHFGISSRRPIWPNGVWISRQASLSRIPEANDYFGRGVRALDRRSQNSATNGAIALERAVALDPKFAVAYAQLALAYGMKGDPHLASNAARKSLALTPTLPEGHAGLAFIAIYYDWNWDAAERELRTAVGADPSYARGHHWLANLYQLQRRFPEADKEMKMALDLDPHSPIINTDSCSLLYVERQFDAAIDQCLKTISIDTDFIPVRGMLASVYLAKGDYDKAVETSITNALKVGAYPELPSQLRAAYQKSGIRGFLEVDLQHRIEVEGTEFETAVDQLRLGRREEAIQTILHAYHSRDFFLPYIACSPVLEPLRSDPRFMDVVRSMGLS